MALCEASAIYLCPIASKLFGHLFLSISLLCAKFHTHLPSNYFPVIFKVSVQKGTLWRKYILGMSKRDEAWSHPPFDQIMHLYQIWAHGDHLCEPNSKSCFVVKFSLVKQPYFTLFHLSCQFTRPFLHLHLPSTPSLGSIQLSFNPQ